MCSSLAIPSQASKASATVYSKARVDLPTSMRKLHLSIHITSHFVPSGIVIRIDRITVHCLQEKLPRARGHGGRFVPMKWPISSFRSMQSWTNILKRKAKENWKGGKATLRFWRQKNHCFLTNGWITILVALKTSALLHCSANAERSFVHLTHGAQLGGLHRVDSNYSQTIAFRFEQGGRSRTSTQSHTMHNALQVHAANSSRIQ